MTLNNLLSRIPETKSLLKEIDDKLKQKSMACQQIKHMNSGIGH